MSIFNESGVTVTLTGFEHHRFCDLPTYRKISGQNIKEVDICWLQPTMPNSDAPTLIALELKDYIQTKVPFDSLFDNLLNKIRDTLSLFTAAWLQQGLGAQIQQELPQSYQRLSPNLKLIFVLLVNIDSNQAATLKALREKINAKIKGIAKLHNIQVTVCNLAIAQNIGLPIAANTAPSTENSL